MAYGCSGAAAQTRSQEIVQPESGSLMEESARFLECGQGAANAEECGYRIGMQHGRGFPRTIRSPAASYLGCRRGKWCRELRHAFSRLAAGKLDPPRPMDQVRVEGAILPAAPRIAAGMGVWIAIEMKAETWTETGIEVVIPVAAGCRQPLPAYRRTPSPDNSLRRRTLHSARENLPA